MNIYVAINEIIKEMPAVPKTQKNKLQGYMYRGIKDIIVTSKPLLAKHGVFVVPKTISQTQKERTNDKGTVLYHTHLTVEHTFYALDGSHIVATTVGEAIDSSDKSCNKAMTAAFKYALNEVLFIAEEDMVDTEEDHHETSTEKKTFTTSNTYQLSSMEAQKNSSLQQNENWTQPLRESGQTGNPGDHVISFGKKHGGKKIRDLTLMEYEQYSTYLLESSAKDRKPLSKGAQDFVDYGKAFFHGGAQEEMQQMDEQIPF